MTTIPPTRHGPEASAPPAGAVPAAVSTAAPRARTAELAARLRLAILRLSRRLRQQVAGGVTSSQVSALATVERLGTPTLGRAGLLGAGAAARA